MSSNSLHGDFMGLPSNEVIVLGGRATYVVIYKVHTIWAIGINVDILC